MHVVKFVPNKVFNFKSVKEFYAHEAKLCFKGLSISAQERMLECIYPFDVTYLNSKELSLKYELIVGPESYYFAFSNIIEKNEILFSEIQIEYKGEKNITVDIYFDYKMNKV